MKSIRRRLLIGIVSLATVAGWFYGEAAWAVPSFSRQTGMACASCHTNGFGPNLTPFGRQFKLDGYTMGGDEKGPLTKGIPPLSGMLLGSFNHTDQSQPRQPVTGPSSPAFNGNNNLAFDQASFFYAGRIYGPVGAFAQFTYDGVGNTVAVDNIDIRGAGNAAFWGHDATFGVSLNNNPTVQDLWNTTPAWAFPFASSPIAPTPGASPLISGLGQQVGGASLYGLFDKLLYLEAGAYGNWSQGTQKNMGVWSSENPALSGAAPYWRIALQHGWDGQYIEIGTFGLQTDIYADRYNKTAGTNQYSDLGADITYQYLGNMEHIVEFRGSYIRENQQLRGTQSLGGSAKNSVMLNTLNLNASYTYQQTYTGTFGFFDISGSTDALLYPDNPSFKPNSQGFITEVDYVPFGKSNSLWQPWLNLRLGLQYVAYTQFNGTATNAGDNNTLYLNGWLAF